jgi:hypothetical protein
MRYVGLGCAMLMQETMLEEKEVKDIPRRHQGEIYQTLDYGLAGRV